MPYDHPLDLTMECLDAPDFKLRDYRGKTVLLNIFATWCGPCVHEQPFFTEAAQLYADRDFAIIGINAAEADDTVRAYRKQYAVPYPIAMDRRGGFTIALENGAKNVNASTNYPVSFFISSDGYLECMVRGGIGREQLHYRIEHSLKSTS